MNDGMDVIEITPEMWDDILPLMNQMLASLSLIGLKHKMDYRVGLGLLWAVLTVVEDHSDACECDSCREAIGDLAEEMMARWERAVKAAAPVRGIH